MPGGVRNRSRPHGPKPRCDQLLVLTGREMHEPMDSALRPRDSASVEVFPQKLSRAACVRRLLRRDVPGQACGSFVKLVAVWPPGLGGHHAQNEIWGFVLCGALGNKLMANGCPNGRKRTYLGSRRVRIIVQ